MAPKESYPDRKISVTLVGNRFEDSVGEGIERYSYELLKGLENRGINVETIKCSEKFEHNLKFTIKFFIYLPLKTLFKKPGTGLYHFTMQHLGLSAYLAKKILKRDVIITIHDLQHNLLKKRWLHWIFDTSIRKAISASDLILVDSTMCKEDIKLRYGIDGKKIIVCLLGTDAKFKIIPRPKNNLFTIGFIGRFADYKNAKFLIRAYNEFEKRYGIQSRLILYGKGEERESCISLAKELGIQNIEFPGFADEYRLVEIYNSFDVFVFPSEFEGFGLPIIEAQKCGLPVIVREGAHVPDEVTKFCFKARDEIHLAEILNGLFINGYNYTQEHKRYMEQFTWDTCVKNTINAYTELAKVKGRFVDG